jgi:hypothetical protein
MSNNANKIDGYTVTFFNDERAYLYPCLSSNHQQALETAYACHLDAGAPLPLGTRCLVSGTCHDTTCNCHGKILVIDGVISPEGLSVTKFQHL